MGLEDVFLLRYCSSRYRSFSYVENNAGVDHSIGISDIPHLTSLMPFTIQ